MACCRALCLLPRPGVSLFRHFRSHPARPPALLPRLKPLPRPGVSLFRRFRSHLARRPALLPRLKPLPRPGVSLFLRFRSHPARRPALLPRLRPLPRPGVSLFRHFRSPLARPPALQPRLWPLLRPGVSLFGDSAPTRHGGPPCGPVCGRCPRPGVSLFRRFRSYLALRPALRPRLKPLPRPGVSLFRRFRSHPARPTRLPTRHLCHQRYSVRQTPISPYRVPLQHHFVRQTSLLRTKDQTTPRPKESPPPNIPTDEPTPKVGGFFALFTPTFRGYRPHVALYGFPAPKVGVDSGIFSPTFRWRGGGAGWRTRGTTGRAARMGRDDTNCQAPSTSHPRQSTEASPACHRHPATPAARHRPSPAEHLTPGRKHLSPEESGARTAQENMEKCRTCHSSRYSCTPT